MKIDYYRFSVLDSTNRYAKSHLSQFDENALSVIKADAQTEGSGRSGPWKSDPGNLFVTFCFQISLSYQPKVSFLPILLSFSLGQYLEEKGLKIFFKWPNDLFLDGKKIGGILGESIPQNNDLWVILGLGFNLNMPEEELNKIDQPATCLQHHLKEAVDIDHFLKELTHLFSQNLIVFFS